MKIWNHYARPLYLQRRTVPYGVVKLSNFIDNEYYRTTNDKMVSNAGYAVPSVERLCLQVHEVRASVACRRSYVISGI